MVSKVLVFIFCALLWLDIVSLPTQAEDWDFLLFAQSWPITTCMLWKNRHQRNTCAFPDDRSAWTVHGIWPTKSGTKGPNFCSTSDVFDQTELKPLIRDLEQCWTNVHKNREPLSFWKYEFEKHGSCAASLSKLKGLRNYFSQGINWNKQFKLFDMLEEAGVTPGKEGYAFQKISNAVKAATGKNPAVLCVVDRYSHHSLLSEIRICFDKALELIDCDMAYTNCIANKPVMYFSELP